MPIMMRGGILLVLMLVVVLPDAIGQASSGLEGPYQRIIERNAFNLKPAPKLEDVRPPAQPPPRITLTGITTILGNKQALMKVQLPPKQPDPVKEESYIIAEGHRAGQIEVLAIDEKAGAVRVNNHGTIQDLNFEQDGAKLAATLPPTIAPPGVPTPDAGAASPLPGPTGFPTRNLRLRPIPGAPPPDVSPESPEAPSATPREEQPLLQGGLDQGTETPRLDAEQPAEPNSQPATEPTEDPKV